VQVEGYPVFPFFSPLDGKEEKSVLHLLTGGRKWRAPARGAPPVVRSGSRPSFLKPPFSDDFPPWQGACLVPSKIFLHEERDCAYRLSIGDFVPPLLNEPFPFCGYGIGVIPSIEEGRTLAPLSLPRH